MPCRIINIDKKRREGNPPNLVDAGPDTIRQNGRSLNGQWYCPETAKKERWTKKEGEAVPHPKCLHIGIILIVYVIQKVVQK